MTDTQTKPEVHPGDIVQLTNGHIALVRQTRPWGVEAIQRWMARGREYESYHRLRYAGGDQQQEFVVVGTAHLMPAEVAQARRDSINTARDVAEDKGQ